MIATADRLWALLDDLELNARQVIRAPRNAPARAALRRASDRAMAFRRLEAARHLLAQAAPPEAAPDAQEDTHGDPRPEPPAELPEVTEPEAAQAARPFGMPPGYRSPCTED